MGTTRQTDWAQVVQTQTFHSLGDFNLSIGQAITSDSLVIAEKMVADKTEEQLREETRARRARQELKNMPLPLNRQQGCWQASKSLVSLYEDDPCKVMLENQRNLNSLSSQRSLNSISENALSRSLQDLSARSLEQPGELRRTRSYSRINDQLSSWEEESEARRSTFSSMFTDTSAFSPRSIAAIRKDDVSIDRPGAIRHLSRTLPPDPTLHDPCWRAARARTVGEKPKIYKWEEKVGVEREHNLSKSTPDLSRLGVSSIPLPTLVRPTMTSRPPLVSVKPSGRGEGNLHSSATNLKSCTDNLKKVSSSSSATVDTGDCLDKTFRQLKVATSWLKSLGSRPDVSEAKANSIQPPNTSSWRHQPTSSSRPSLSSCAARWSTQGSQRRSISKPTENIIYFVVLLYISHRNYKK